MASPEHEMHAPADRGSRPVDGPMLWLVRHGESTWNVLGLVQGHSDDATLTAVGRHQADQAARSLARRMADGRSIAAVHASDLRRARETAVVIADRFGVDIVATPALRERSLGAAEGGPTHRLGPELSGIEADQVVDVQARPSGGESLEDLYWRVGGFVDRLRSQQSDGDIVAVAHGGSIRAIRAYCAGRPVQDMDWDPVPNGSVWSVPSIRSASTKALPTVRPS